MNESEKCQLVRMNQTHLTIRQKHKDRQAREGKSTNQLVNRVEDQSPQRPKKRSLEFQSRSPGEQSEIRDRKMFAEEYSRITTSLKNIMNKSSNSLMRRSSNLKSGLRDRSILMEKVEATERSRGQWDRSSSIGDGEMQRMKKRARGLEEMIHRSLSRNNKEMGGRKNISKSMESRRKNSKQGQAVKQEKQESEDKIEKVRNAYRKESEQGNLVLKKRKNRDLNYNHQKYRQKSKIIVVPPPPSLLADSQSVSHSYLLKKTVNGSMKVKVGLHKPDIMLISTPPQEHSPRPYHPKWNCDRAHLEQFLSHCSNVHCIISEVKSGMINKKSLMKAIKQYVFSASHHSGGKADIKMELFNHHLEHFTLQKYFMIEKIVVLGIMDTQINRGVSGPIACEIMELVKETYGSVFKWIISEGGSDLLLRISVEDTEGKLRHGLDCMATNREQVPLKQIYESIKNHYLPKLCCNSSGISLTQYLPKMLKPLSESPLPSINKSFYLTLSQYSQYLNTIDSPSPSLTSFMTSPCPHLAFPRSQSAQGKHCHYNHKVLTVVLQFEGVLGLVREVQGKRIIKLRPGSRNLVMNMLGWGYEVVIFTYLMPNDLEPASITHDEEENQYLKLFELADATLYRHHWLRVKGHLFKDLSQLGRNLNEVILIDHNKEEAQQCEILRKFDENTLYVEKWKGMSFDQELGKVKKIVEILSVQVHDQNFRDVREVINRGRMKARKGLMQIKEVKEEGSNIFEDGGQGQDSDWDQNDDDEDVGDASGDIIAEVSQKSESSTPTNIKLMKYSKRGKK